MSCPNKPTTKENTMTEPTDRTKKTMRKAELCRRAGIEPAQFNALLHRGAVPWQVEPRTGWRMYSVDQAERLRNMVQLINLGFQTARARDISEEMSAAGGAGLCAVILARLNLLRC